MVRTVVPRCVALSWRRRLLLSRHACSRIDGGQAPPTDDARDHLDPAIPVGMEISAGTVVS